MICFKKYVNIKKKINFECNVSRLLLLCVILLILLIKIIINIVYCVLNNNCIELL